MPEISKRIPLFPLELVLFPGLPLPLHIFETRYKQMMRRCLLDKLEFGVILSQKEAIATTGCSAEIVTVAKQYPDGRMDILVEGKRPFHVKEVYDDKPYFEALVEFIEEPQTNFATPSGELRELYEQCYWLLFNSGPDAISARSKIAPSYMMAGALPMDVDDKQVLLEIRDEGERQQHLFEQLQAWLPRLVYLNERRERSRGNGHALN